MSSVRDSLPRDSRRIRRIPFLSISRSTSSLWTISPSMKTLPPLAAVSSAILSARRTPKQKPADLAKFTFIRFEPVEKLFDPFMPARSPIAPAPPAGRWPTGEGRCITVPIGVRMDSYHGCTPSKIQRRKPITGIMIRSINPRYSNRRMIRKPKRAMSM
jgi:hypothetical protein